MSIVHRLRNELLARVSNNDKSQVTCGA